MVEECKTGQDSFRSEAEKVLNEYNLDRLYNIDLSLLPKTVEYDRVRLDQPLKGMDVITQFFWLMVGGRVRREKEWTRHQTVYDAHFRFWSGKSPVKVKGVEPTRGDCLNISAGLEHESVDLPSFEISIDHDEYMDKETIETEAEMLKIVETKWVPKLWKLRKKLSIEMREAVRNSHILLEIASYTNEGEGSNKTHGFSRGIHGLPS